MYESLMLLSNSFHTHFNDFKLVREKIHGQSACEETDYRKERKRRCH